MVLESRPDGPAAYREWCNVRYGVKSYWTEQAHDRYRNQRDRLRESFERSEYWRDFWARLKELDTRHLSTTGDRLLAHGLDRITVVAKEWDSVLDKVFRHDVVQNNSWPDPPTGGWAKPPWHSEFADIIRTTIVVKYLDGVDPVHRLLVETAEAHVSCACSQGDFKHKEEGYYACHIDLTAQLSTLTALGAGNSPWESETEVSKVEVQVCTQMQEVIRNLTHEVYQSHRLNQPDPVPNDRPWQWQWTSDEFVPNYLGHLLQFTDGVIQRARDERRQAPADV
jgi:ppGpp synthetase/RelA/SpoT-type nucleotidyltranferase